MKALLSTAVLSVCLSAGAVALWPVSARAGEVQPKPPTTQPAAKPVNKFCPINQDNEIDPAVTYLYKGKLIGFCCPDCIAEFKANPEKYMKTLK